MQHIPKKVSTVFSFVLVGILLVLFFMAPRKEFPQMNNLAFDHEATLGAGTLFVSVANTDDARELGLSYTKVLEPNNGMVFVFDPPTIPAFWMKGMRYSLDIIWIDADGKVQGFETNLSPKTYPKSFSPYQAVRYVLEVPAGYVEYNGIGIGDQFSL